MIKCIKHGKIRIICRITLDQYHPSGIKALWMILVSRDNTAYDTDFAMYYSLYISLFTAGLITTSATNNIDYESFTTKTADITVTVSDGQDSDAELLQITITNVNEAPVFVQNSYSISGNEGPVCIYTRFTHFFHMYINWIYQTSQTDYPSQIR